MRLLSAALLFVLLLSACGDDPLPPPLEVYENGRAEVLARTDSGRTLRLEHEPMDSVMTEPMVMELLVDDPREAAALQNGDKISFDLVLRQNYRLHNVEKLPADTRLQLTPADTSSADSSDTPS